MATYYVSKSGNDSNAGTSAGAAWLTIGKALGASGIASADTVYVGPGVYRESVTIAMTSPGAETFVIADVEGNFTSSVGGEVRWTAYTTNDKTAPATTTLNMAGRDNLTFQRFTFVGGSASCVDAYNTPVSTNVKFQDCTFFSGTGGAARDRLIWWSNAAGEAANWTVERCIFWGTCGAYINIANVTFAASSYSLAFVIRNCLFVGASYGELSSATRSVISCEGSGGSGTGSGSASPGGVTVQNCTNLVGATALLHTDTYFSTSVPCYVKNCVTFAGLSAFTSGQIVEDYNVVIGPVARANVSTGTNSKTGNTYCPLMYLGQERQQGKLMRPFGSPTIDSPLLAFGNDTSNPTALSTDFSNRPKPSGSGVTWSSVSKAIGYMEAHDFGVQEVSTVDSVNSVKMAGPGDMDFLVPVRGGVPVTISVKVNRDTNYGGGTLPQIILLANGSLSVSTQTVTDAGSASVWNTISLSAFTPIGRGWVTVRLNSQSAATGVVYWDTFTVS